MVYPVLTVIFYLLACLPLVFGQKEKDSPVSNQEEKKARLIFLGAAGLNILLRLPLLGAAPFPTDLDCFKAWALRMAEVGPARFYAPDFFCDYPPGGLYLLWPMGVIIKAFSLIGHGYLANAIVKLPALLADLCTAWLVFLLLRKNNPRLALLVALLYLYLPAVIYNSSYWGQADGYYTFLVVLAFYLLTRDRAEAAGAALAAALLIKPQTVAFIPIFGLFALLRYRPSRIIKIVAAALVTAVVIILPFSLGRPFFWIIDHYAKMAGEYPYATFNAANFHALLSGNSLADGTRLLGPLSYRLIGIGLFLLVCFFGGYYLYHHREEEGLSTVLAVTALGFFLFFPRMHERYLFPFFGLFFLAHGYRPDRRLYFLNLLLSAAYLLNLHTVVLYYAGRLPAEPFNRALYLLAMVNTAVFAGMILILSTRLPEGGRLAAFLKRYQEGLLAGRQQELNTRPFPLGWRDGVFLAILLSFYAGLVFFRLGSRMIPVTGTEIKEGLEVVLASPAEVTGVILYDAEGAGSFLLEGYTQNNWNLLADISTENFYVQKKFSFAGERLTRLRLVPLPFTGRINELAFLGPDQEFLPVGYVLTADGRRLPAEDFPLFDEQNRLRSKISYLNSTYFDEIYHGRTGYEFTQKTTVYETTHPPFGKDLIALGITLFGMNPFGMRFIPALLGVALMAALFFLGREAFGCRFGAYAVMALGMLDFMPFVQSRYSTIDTPSVLFITLMFLFTLRSFRHWEERPTDRRPLLEATAALFFFALGAATKWTAVYGFAGAALVFLLAQFRRYQKLKLTEGKTGTGRKIVLGDLGLVFLVFLLLVPTVYYLTYIPFLRCAGINDLFSREAVRTVIKSQKDMYAYHSQLKATHPFSSSWWSWPFDFKPLWIYPDKPIDTAPGNRAVIVSMGNPLVWWAGLCAGLLLFYHLLTLPSFSLMHLVLLGFFAQYLPWTLVTRCTFIYHFYPVLPFYYLFIAWALKPLWGMGGRARRGVIGFFLVALILLALFYPTLSGLEVVASYIETLRWFPADWAF